MSKQRKILLILLAGAIALTAFLVNGLRHQSNDLAAREKLNTLLGQADETIPDDQSPFTPYPSAPATPSPPPNNNNNNGHSHGYMGLPIPNPLANSGLPDSGVNVQESSDAYTLRIPLINAADARNVKVNVTPHHIEVSGNIGRREQNVTFSSSFMQSFSTSQTVLPEKMTQKTEKNDDKTELVIRVPKKTSSQPNLAPPPAPAAPVAPEAPNGGNLPEDNGTEHRVI